MFRKELTLFTLSNTLLNLQRDLFSFFFSLAFAVLVLTSINTPQYLGEMLSANREFIAASTKVKCR